MNIEMFDELSDEDLDRIERLVEAASAGPWISLVTGRDAHAESNCIEMGLCNELGSFVCIELVGGGPADQDFVASARQDVPRLLREVRSLRARLESLLTERGRPQLTAVRSMVEGTTALTSGSM